MLPARRWLAFFSAAVLAALAAVLAVLLPAGTASAGTGPAAETRVWAIVSAAHDHVGADQLVSAGQRLGEPHACPFCAPGACVAPEDVPAALQARAAELQGMRERPWLIRNGTTAAIAARNVATGDVTTFIATEAETMPTTWEGLLKSGEQFVSGAGHAEETIFNYLGDQWKPIAGGTSRNVCVTVCAPLIEDSGGTLGGPVFPWNPTSGLPKTDYRMFWWNR